MKDFEKFDNYVLEFGKWLKNVKGQKESAISSRISNIKTVGQYYDVLKEFVADECQNLLEELSFSKADIEPKTNIVINGDYYNGLATYRQSVKLFVAFLNDIKYTSSIIASNAQTRESLNLFKGSVKKGPEQTPFTPPCQGRDENRELVYYLVYYNDNVDINKRVEGLCEKLEIEYIEYLRHFASYIFRDIIDGDFYLPKVVLCKECPSEIWTNSDSFVTRKVNELIKKVDLVNEQQIAQILRHRTRISGEFIHNPQPLIKIYFNQFDSADWDEYFAEISQTLAHEYMHYLEYEYCRRSGNKSYNDANVSEALADFFSVIYSLNRGTDRFVITKKERIEVAEKDYNEWVKWDGSGWPYAYALYFMKKRIRGFSPIFREYYDKGCIEKLRTVFVATLNPKDAYDKLINL